MIKYSIKDTTLRLYDSANRTIEIKYEREYFMLNVINNETGESMPMANSTVLDNIEQVVYCFQNLEIDRDILKQAFYEYGSVPIPKD